VRSRLSPARGRDDLFALYDHVAEEARHATAGSYIDGIEAACIALESFPERGMRRDDIRRGLRTIGFERGGRPSLSR